MSRAFHITSAADLGPRLVELRVKKGMSQRAVALAPAVRINPNSLRLWELGHTMPCTNSLNKLLAFYGVTATIGMEVPS